MNRNEFQERLEFRRLLRGWAATQPGYKPPVTTADVQEVMAKLAKITSLKKSDNKTLKLAKLKYSYLVQVINKTLPATSLPVLEEGAMLSPQQIEAMLLSEKLLDVSKNVTDLGRRFVDDFDHAEEKGK